MITKNLKKPLVRLLTIFAAGNPFIQAYESTLIDTHVHLWHLDRPEGIYWIPKDSRALYRSFMPEDHEAIAKKME